MPTDLVAYYQKLEIKRSLRTSDRREAQRLVKIESAFVEKGFEEHRRLLAEQLQPIETVATCVLEDLASRQIGPT